MIKVVGVGFVGGAATFGFELRIQKHLLVQKRSEPALLLCSWFLDHNDILYS